MAPKSSPTSVGHGRAHVNLIPISPVVGRQPDHSATDSANVHARRIGGVGVNATVRHGFGQISNAACSQLQRHRTRTGNKHFKLTNLWKDRPGCDYRVRTSAAAGGKIGQHYHCAAAGQATCCWGMCPTTAWAASTAERIAAHPCLTLARFYNMAVHRSERKNANRRGFGLTNRALCTRKVHL